MSFPVFVFNFVRLAPENGVSSTEPWRRVGKGIYEISNNPYQDVPSNYREVGRCGRKRRQRFRAISVRQSNSMFAHGSLGGCVITSLNAARIAHTYILFKRIIKNLINAACIAFYATENFVHSSGSIAISLILISQCK